jgi:hypothetical protein
MQDVVNARQNAVLGHVSSILEEIRGDLRDLRAAVLGRRSQSGGSDAAPPSAGASGAPSPSPKAPGLVPAGLLVLLVALLLRSMRGTDHP